ncbi:MAG: hypothetical protein V4555_12665, partial [Acidobacteriota bacterium]
MTKRLQRGAVERSHSLWMRTLAMACVLVIGLASSAQAVHVHGEFLPQNAAKARTPVDASQIPGGEINCPLCVAMHSALPSALGSASLHAVMVESREATSTDRVAAEPWHF